MKKSFAFLHPNLGVDVASITFNMSRGMENSFIFVIYKFWFHSAALKLNNNKKKKKKKNGHKN